MVTMVSARGSARTGNAAGNRQMPKMCRGVTSPRVSLKKKISCDKPKYVCNVKQSKKEILALLI